MKGVNMADITYYEYTQTITNIHMEQIEMFYKLHNEYASSFDMKFSSPNDAMVYVFNHIGLMNLSDVLCLLIKEQEDIN
jgi:hypothetical protein